LLLNKQSHVCRQHENSTFMRKDFLRTLKKSLPTYRSCSRSFS
jgi:hypothetical protein